MIHLTTFVGAGDGDVITVSKHADPKFSRFGRKKFLS